jgi:D-beta-D-heptose 7-phosphate kinase/D-beta-D-heptose 1-phosphate adenosyltransferase
VPVLNRADAAAFVSRARDAGKRIVFTNGVFDLLHIGHVRYLKRARSLGDVLVVGVNADSSVRRLGKGPERPVTPEGDRAEIIAALSYVDAVVVFEEDTPAAIIETLLPDILVKGADWEGKENPGQQFIEARGGRMVFIPLESGYSTTGLLKSLRTP